MRNLKRVLALAMAMVMILGMMVIGSSAASYTDAAAITEDYAEAVDVLTGLGVFRGQSTTEAVFAPKAELTRAEAAALIYRVITGDVKDAQKSNYDYASLKDVKAGDWYTGYVTYANNGGYIKGDDLGNFNPYAKVTGIQVLAIMLRAAGYGQNGEYEGAAWKDNILTDAYDLKIIGKIAVATLDAPASRELVAQLIFNALTSVKMVSYTPALGYIAANITGMTKAQTLGEKVFKLACKEGYVTYSPVKKNMVLTDVEDDSVIVTAMQDIFDAGRYGHVWVSGIAKKAVTDVYYDDTVLATKYNGNGMGTWTNDKKPDYVADGAVTKYFYNGAEVAANNSDLVAALNKRGAEVQLIDVVGKGEINTVIVVEQIADVLETDPVVKNENVKIYAKYDNQLLTTKTASGYEELVEDDVFLYVKMADGVTYFELADVVEGQKTYYYNGAKGEYMTFAGEKTEKSELDNANDAANLFDDAKVTFEKDAYVYVDRGGYVIETKIPGVFGKYAMVVDCYKTLADDHASMVYYANLLLTDGTETGYVEVKATDDVKTGAYAFPYANVKGEYNELGTLVTFIVNKDGLYELTYKTPVNAELTDDYAQGGAYMEIGGTDYAVTNSTVAFYYYYVVVEDGTDREETKVYYGVNTGKGEIPAYGYDANVDYAEAVADADGDKILKVAVMNSDVAHAATDYAYIFSFDGKGTTTSDRDIFYYTGVLSDGTVKEFTTPVPSNWVVGEVVGFYINEEGNADFSYAINALVSAELTADGTTVKIITEGKDPETTFVNVNDVYDLTNTRGLKDGDTVDNFNFGNRKVQAIVVPNVEFDGILPSIQSADITEYIETVFVLDEDVIYGDFTINGDEWHLPVSTYWTEEDIAYTLEGLGYADAADEAWHIHYDAVCDKVESDEAYVFVDGEDYTVVEHVDVTIEVTAKEGTLVGDTLTVDADTVLADGGLLNTPVITGGTMTAWEGPTVSADGKTATIVIKAISDDGCCTAEKTINVYKLNNGTALESVKVDGTEITIPSGSKQVNAAADRAENLGAKDAAFKMTVKAADELAKVEIGSGDTVDNAVKDLEEATEVTVTESTAKNGGYIVIKVTAEDESVKYYVYNTAAATPAQ